MNEFVKRRLAVFGQRALSTPNTVHNSYLLAERCLTVPVDGDFVECGVFDGTQIAAMALANQMHQGHRKIHLFDSFMGIPQAGPNDGKDIRACIGEPKKGDEGRLTSSGVDVTSIKVVQKHMKEWGIDKITVQLIYHEGWFQDTVPAANIKKIALLRLDGDLYESTKVCLENLHSSVTKGGYVIIDDYNLIGCRKACEEYWQSIKFEPVIQVIENGGGPVFYRRY